MKKIVHVIDDLGLGGAQRQLVELLKGLPREGWQVEVIALSTVKADYASRIRELGIPLTLIAQKGKWSWSAFSRLLGTLKRSRPDIVQTWLFTADLYGRIAAKLAGVPLIVSTVRSTETDKPWHYVAADRLLKGWTDKFIVNANSVGNTLSSREKVHVDRIAVVYNGLDMKRFDPSRADGVFRKELGISDGTPLIGIVGRLAPVKDHETFLRAAALILKEKPSARFLVVGDGPLKGKLKILARQLGILESVLFVESRQPVEEVYSSLDLLVVSSVYEGCSNVILEAMAMGKPVVATDVGGNAELVLSGETGLVVSARNPEQIASAVRKLLDDPQARAAMGTRARRIAEQKFSLDRMVKETDAVYRGLIKLLLAMVLGAGLLCPRPALAGPPPLTLADFENPNEPRVQWQSKEALITQTGSYATNGKFGAKLMFRDSVSPKVMLRGYLRFDGERRNWSRFLTLAIDFYNPYPSQERLGIQLKDSKERTYKEEIILPGGTWTTLRVQLSDAQSHVDLKNIIEMSLFRWRPGRPSTFYVDYVRLEPELNPSMPAIRRPVPGQKTAAAMAEQAAAQQVATPQQTAAQQKMMAQKAVADRQAAAAKRGPDVVLPPLQPSTEASRVVGVRARTDAQPAGTLDRAPTLSPAPTAQQVVQAPVQPSVPPGLPPSAYSDDDDEDDERTVDGQPFVQQPAGESTDSARMGGAAVAELPARPGEWRVGWTSSLVKVLRDPQLFNGKLTNPLQVWLAGGETEGVQLALIGGAAPSVVEVSVGDLRHLLSGSVIPGGAVDVYQVGYVKTNKPYYPVNHVGEWPDPLFRKATIEVPGGRVQPVWLDVSAPENAVPGRYDGVVTLRDQRGATAQVTLQVWVWNFNLPRVPTLKTAFDFYRFRLEKAYKEFVPGGAKWAGQMDELQRRYYLAMLDSRLSPVWSADPSSPAFSSDLKLYTERGMSLFGIGQRGGNFGNNWPSDPKELKSAMEWYTRAAEGLRSAGLLERAYVYAFDEPSPGDPKAEQVLRALHEAAPGLKTLLVMHEAPNPDKHKKWFKEADILCLRATSVTPELVAKYRSLGKEVWMYVSSPSHPYPTPVIDYPTISSRIIPWMCWKGQIDGLLYWCVNFWEGDPMKNPSSFAKDQNGNGFLFYPGDDGPVGSIRLKALRDGVEDYEYLNLLKQAYRAAKIKGRLSPALAVEAEHLLEIDPALISSQRTYSKDPDVLLGHRRAVAEMIEKLQALLAAG